MMLSKKWILFCFIITTFILTTSSHPTTTNVVHIRKRQDATNNGADISSVADYHHVTLSRTSATTTTATATATATGKGGKGGNGGSTPTSSGDKNPEPSVIPAKTPSWYVAVYGTESGISPRMAALGAILIALGLFLCSMGARMFRYMLPVMGLLTFGSMAWIGLANCRPASGYSMDSITMIVVPACIGVVGAIAYYFVWTVATYLASAFAGFLFAVFILSWRSDLVITNLIGRSCFLGGMALVAGAATYFMSRKMIFFSTSFVGAYIFMFGVDCLSRTGFIAGPQAMLNRNPNHRVEYVVSTWIYVMLAMIILMFLISLVWQMIFNAAHHIGLHIVAAAKGKPAHDEAKEEGHLSDGPPSSPPPS